MTYPSSFAIGRRTALPLLALALPLVVHGQSVEIQGDRLTPKLASEIRTAIGPREDVESPLAARRLGQRAMRTAEAVLNANGYFAPTIDETVDPGPPPRAILDIDPGPHFEVAGIALTYRGEPPSEDAKSAARRALTLEVGDVALPTQVLGQEQLIRAALRRAGYPDAAVTGRDTVGNREDGTISVTYRIRSGPPVILGAVRFEDTAGVRASYLNRFVPFARGVPYAPGELDSLRRRLSQDRLFRSARVTLDDTAVRVAPSGAEVRDVIVRLQPRKKNRVAAGVRFATDEGFGLTGEYSRRNVFKRADTITSTLSLAELQRRLAITWDRPHEFGFGRDLELATSLEDETTDAFDSRRAALSAFVEQTISPRLSYTLGVTGELVRETVPVDVRSAEDVERDRQILTFNAGVRLDRANDALNPTRGWRTDLAIEPAVTSGDASTQLLKTTAQLRAYRPIDVDERLVAAVRLRAGSVVGGSFNDVPSSKRFFGGGGGSVRGFEFQSIGPKAVDGQPVGGQSLLETSAELRWQVREPFGVVAFIDGGRVTDDPELSFDQFRFGAGVGLRYNTVAGPIRFDIGTPLDRRDGEDPVQVYLSVGQAF